MCYANQLSKVRQKDNGFFVFRVKKTAIFVANNYFLLFVFLDIYFRHLRSNKKFALCALPKYFDYNDARLNEGGFGYDAPSQK